MPSPIIPNYNHHTTLCFDIDGCLSMLSQANLDLPQCYKDAILEQLKQLVFAASIENEKISHSHITLCLFTNRKDPISDVTNMQKHSTYSASSTLVELKRHMDTWLADTSLLTLDSSYHISQVFDDIKPTDLYATLVDLQSDSTSSKTPHHPYHPSQAPGSHKCDLATTILARHAHTGKNHHIYFFDDRLNPTHTEKGLDTLAGFFSQNPMTVPQNCTVHMVQLDPYIDLNAHNNYLYDFIMRNVKQKKPSINQPKLIKAFKRMLKTDFSDYQLSNPNANLDAIKAMVHSCYGANLDTHSGRERYAQQQQQQALQLIQTIQGTGTYPDHLDDKAVLWQNILMPMADCYLKYLDTPTALHEQDLGPFNAKNKRKSFPSLLEDALLEESLFSPNKKPKTTPPSPGHTATL